ncbi:MAG: hypothetical protein JW731_10290 [Bacteroidales bacterium]|nr:hypothetical protein [Bacteroidales bacterium]
MVFLFHSFAQSPQAFKYQAVARDASGELISNQQVSFQISLLHGGPTGTVVYSETFDPVTNDQGLVNLEIGNGIVVSGDFGTIDWSLGDYFLQIEMDETGGTNYQIMGTSQLLSVPFAMYAESSGSSDDGDWEVSGNNIYTGQDKNIGIGTSSPALPFILEHDWGNGLGQHPLAQFQNHNNAGNAGIRAYYWGDGTTATGAGFRATSGKSLYLGTWSEAQAITIIDNGNVGIGTTNPTVKLELQNAGSSAYENTSQHIAIYSDEATAYSRIKFHRSHSSVAGDDTSSMAVTQDGDKLGMVVFGGNRINGAGASSNTSGWMEMVQKGAPTGTGVPGQIQFTTSNGLGGRDTRMVIDPIGNVGIGTDSPVEKLDVEGNLDMNGYQIKNMVIENRTSDPSNPAVGRIWIRIDL